MELWGYLLVRFPRATRPGLRAYGIRPRPTLISSARPNVPSRVNAAMGSNADWAWRYDVGSPRRMEANTSAMILPPTGPSLIGMSSLARPGSAFFHDVTCASDRM